MNLTTRWLVFERDAFSCQYCGRSAPHVILQVDHIEAKSRGGSNDIGNLVTACWACNQGKKARDGHDGLTMKSWQKAQWADRRAEAMLDILVAAYADEIGCTTGDVVEWLDGEVA